MDVIAHATAHLRRGGLVAMPTETVYGLAAIARDADAVGRVFEAKGRPSTNPLIVHASTLEMARDCCASWPVAADALARAFWPGPLTLVLPKAQWVPEIVTAGGPTVAVRVPQHPLAIALLDAVGEPLVAPSANPSGYVSPTSVEHVRGVWPEERVVVLDGGACSGGLESTVLAVESAGVRVLRRGVLGGDELAKVAGVPLLDSESGGSGPLASPGLAGAHYQPALPLVLASTLDEADAWLGLGPACVLSAPGVPLAVDPPHQSMPMPADGESYARELYAAMRDADESGALRIVVCAPLASGAVWDAVRERLVRATAR